MTLSSSPPEDTDLSGLLPHLRDAAHEGEGPADPRAQLKASTELRLVLLGTIQDWHAESIVNTIP